MADAPKIKQSALREIRVGDEWALLTNNGYIVRNVAVVWSGRVWYRSYGDVYHKECALSTFKRWAKGAKLTYAKDWSGRDGITKGDRNDR